jgi:hypothetical protein
MRYGPPGSARGLVHMTTRRLASAKEPVTGRDRAQIFAGAQVRRIETLTDASMAMRRDLAHHHRLFDLICAERSA